MGYVNHHDKKTDKNGVKGENVGKTVDALLKAIIMCAKIPSPNCTHNNRY